MCDPVSAMVGVALFSGVSGAASQYQAGKDNASIAKANAKVMDYSANEAIDTGNSNAAQSRQQARKALASQTAALASNGVDISSGTSLNLLGDTAAAGEMDALTTVHNSLKEAYGYKQQALNYRNEAVLARRQGNANAMSTLLTGGINSYGIYSKK